VRRLSLYESPPAVALELAEPLNVDHACRRCNLPEIGRPKTVCINAEGEAGGLLVVGEAPGRNEDAIGRPFIGKSGKLLRETIAKHWKGPVAYDNAVRCFPGRDGPDDPHIEACRGYLTKTAIEAEPTRIVCVGGWAAYSVLGRAVAPFSTRRGYSFLARTRQPVPVFLVIHPSAALRNRFVRQWFEDDMAWALKANVSTPPWDGVVHVVENADDARLAVKYLRSFPWSSFDVETAGLMYDPSFRIVCISFCPQGERDAFLWGGEAFADPQAVDIMLEYLRDVGARKRGQNVKYDENSADFEWDARVRGLDGDTRLWRKLLDPEAAADLARMCELVGMGGMKEEKDRYSVEAVKKVRGIMAAEKRYEKALAEYPAKLANSKTRKPPVPPVPPPPLSTLGIDAELEPVVREKSHGTSKNKNWAHDSDSWVYAVLDHTNRDVVYRYNARDAVATTALCEVFEPALAAVPPLQRVWDRIVAGASTAIAQVERWGIPTDRGAIIMFDKHLEGKELDAKRRLDSYFPNVNWNSAPQLRKILFKDLGLRVIRITDNDNESTDKDTLEELEGEHELIPALLEYRRITKMRSTYAIGMLPHVRPDGRIHPSILLDGARSGRTSCKDPNLQNIPRVDDPESPTYKGPEGKMARDCFCARPGYLLLSADYSQLELRIAAMLSNDPVMKEIFRSGVDFHKRTAQMVAPMLWHITAEQVGKEHRAQAKAVNFGVLYGMTARTLAANLGCTVAEAQRVMDAILGKFVRLAAWCKERLSESRRTGESWTMWDGERARRRSLHRIADEDDGQRITAENGAVNTPIQGTASDYCVRSIVDVVDWLREDAVPAMLCLPVHDSLLLEVREDAVPEVAYQVKRIMESYPSGDVELKVDIEVGRAWGSLEKYKEAA